MLIQAKTKAWQNKLKACKNEKEINTLILRSGNETVSIRMNTKTFEEFYRPCIGKFIIISFLENDDLIFLNIDDAISKSNEIKTYLQSQNAAFSCS